jgi:hypothetical protein
MALVVPNFQGKSQGGIRPATGRVVPPVGVPGVPLQATQRACLLPRCVVAFGVLSHCAVSRVALNRCGCSIGPGYGMRCQPVTR